MRAKDVEVRLQSGALAAAGGTNTIYGGVNPVALGGEGLVVDLRVSALGKNLAIGEDTIADPAADPVTTVETVARWDEIRRRAARLHSRRGQHEPFRPDFRPVRRGL